MLLPDEVQKRILSPGSKLGDRLSAITFSYAGSHQAQGNVAEHAHRGAELMYVASGECRLEGDSRKVLYGTPNTLFLIPPGMAHRRRNISICKIFYVVFDITPCAWVQNFRYLNIYSDRLIRRWFQDLVILNRESDKDTATAITQTILSRILHCESANNLLQELPRGVQTALHYIEEHYHLPLTIGEITQAACLSQSYLNALFRRITGMGTRQYLEYYRMRIARQLLQDPNFSIAEVAYHCGFSDPHYFSRRFQDFHQQSPSEFRRNPTQAGDFADMRNSLVKSDSFRNL